MGRSPCCDKVGLKKGPWTPEEDQKLLAYVEKHGHGSWRALPNKAQARYQEGEVQHAGGADHHPASCSPWQQVRTNLKKRLAKMGIDPVTHKPKSDTLSSVDGRLKSASNLNHMAQWESARLEAEARLVSESKLRCSTPPSANTTFTPKHQPPLQPPVTMPLAASPCLDVLSAWQGVRPKPAANKSQGRGYTIDLKSPTSTLSFSDNMMPSTSSGIGTAEGNYGEDQQWKCLRKADFSTDSVTPFVSAESSSWLSESCGGDFAVGFTGMLLDKTDEQNSTEGCEDSDNAEGGSCVDVEEGEGEEDENKSYWSSILNLVNSSSPPNSPPPVF